MDTHLSDDDIIAINKNIDNRIWAVDYYQTNSCLSSKVSYYLSEKLAKRKCVEKITSEIEKLIVSLNKEIEQLKSDEDEEYLDDRLEDMNKLINVYHGTNYDDYYFALKYYCVNDKIEFD